MLYLWFYFLSRLARSAYSKKYILIFFAGVTPVKYFILMVSLFKEFVYYRHMCIINKRKAKYSPRNNETKTNRINYIPRHQWIYCQPVTSAIYSKCQTFWLFILECNNLEVDKIKEGDVTMRRRSQQERAGSTDAMLTSHWK